MKAWQQLKGRYSRETWIVLSVYWLYVAGAIAILVFWR